MEGNRAGADRHGARQKLPGETCRSNSTRGRVTFVNCTGQRQRDSTVAVSLLDCGQITHGTPPLVLLPLAGVGVLLPLQPESEPIDVALGRAIPLAWLHSFVGAIRKPPELYRFVQRPETYVHLPFVHQSSFAAQRF